MATNDPERRDSLTAGGEHRPATGWALRAFVGAVFVAGAAVLVREAAVFYHGPVDGYVVLLAALTVASGRFKIKVPGRPATVSVSEIFVFVSILLYGPGPATLTVAFDGLLISLTQADRRLYRALFNVTEPAVSTWVAGSVFFIVAGSHPEGLWHAGPGVLVLPTIAMAAAYFIMNSVLMAAAVAIENGASAFAVWKGHALYLGINYYAAASLATLVVASPSGLNFAVGGLVAPLLILSYVSYKSAASRVEDADRHIRDVEHLYQAAVETLAIAVDAKDQVTHGHIRRVQRHTVAVAKALGVSEPIELKALEAASLLHDVGKLAVPDYVLNKPGALDRNEFETIKLHATKGAEILTAVEFPYPVVPIVRHHHEQWNGGGYPDGISGTDIPLGARILTVVDCFDAVTSDRPYRRRMSDEEGTAILRARSGSMYDPDVVDAFIRLIPELRRADAAVDARHAAVAVAAAVPHRAAAVTARPAGNPEPPGRSDAPLGAFGPALEERFTRVMPGKEFCLFAADKAASTLVAAHSTPRVQDAVRSLRLRIGEGLSGWVAANRHMIVNSGAELDLGDAGVQLGLRTCTSAPVFALGDLVGILTVYSPRAEGLSPAEVRLVGALAQEVGMESAQRELASLRSERIDSSLDMRPVSRLIAFPGIEDVEPARRIRQ